MCAAPITPQPVQAPRWPLAGRVIAWVGIGLGVLALAVWGSVYSGFPETTAYHLWKVSAVLGGLAILVALVVVAAAFLGRVGRWLALGNVLAALGSGYVICCVVVGHHEQERSWQMLACGVRLTKIHMAVERYVAEHGRYPARLEDLDLPPSGCECSVSHQEYILWPKGVPPGPVRLPLERLWVVAAEATPAHRTLPILWFTPYPRLSSSNPHPFLEEIPPKDRKWWEGFRRTMMGVPCKGPLHINGDGSVDVPGGAYHPFDYHLR